MGATLAELSAHVCAYRLLRRLMLLTLPKGRHDNPSHSLPEYVTWFIEQPGSDANSTRLGDLVRGLADERRSLELYSPEEMAQVCTRIAARLAAVSPDGDGTQAEKNQAAERAAAWPNWPDKWRESYAETMREQR